MVLSLVSGVPDLTVSSLLAEAMRRPSGLNATPYTVLVCPLSVSVSRPVTASQILTVPSPLPDASRLPSGLNATLDGTRVSLERERYLAGDGIPDLDRRIVAG